jgi:ATP:ADP antiporter, AAA family
MQTFPRKGVLSRLAKFESGEMTTAFLMLAYSFLAMASYNVVKPITRSKFIDSLGSVNIPFVQLAAGLLIGFIMIGYGWLISRLPRRWSLPMTQLGLVGLLVLFWFLFKTGGGWVPVAFYLLGLILGVLLVSQFWIFANLIYDARQAKRLFGFVGAGSSLGGLVGNSITGYFAKTVGSTNLLLVSASMLALCSGIVVLIIRKEGVAGFAPVREEQGVGGKQAFQLLRESKHLQVIALVISFASIGAAVIEQQLNMFAQATAGSEGGIAEFLGKLGAWTSGIGFLIQILLTSRIHRFLGIGFALMILPVSLGTTGLVILFSAALWAPGVARVLDQSLRYTVDKTTREILFMPLPSDIKMQAKPFVDVTVDRVAKGVSALLLLVLVQPWGLHLGWQKLSYASLILTVLWIFMALRARRGYLETFRRSIETRDVKPGEIRLAVADLQTVEMLVEELSSTEPRRVLYAMEILESLDKRNLVSPLLLYHESKEVRVRAVGVLDGAPPQVTLRWLPGLRRLLNDPDVEVRMAAVGALAMIESVDVADIVRPLLHESNARIAMTAAMILSRSRRPDDVAGAEEALRALAGDPRDSAIETRKELASALRHVREPRFRRLLVPLMMDSSTDVAEEALRSVCQMRDTDSIFIPSLVALLRHPRLKGRARDLLVDCGEDVLDILAQFLREPEEDLAVRIGIPAAIARIPSRRSAEILVGALGETDGALRASVVAGLETLRRRNPNFTFPRPPVEALILKECESASRYFGLYASCCAHGKAADRLLARALREKTEGSSERVFGLLSLLYPLKDIASARVAIDRGGTSRSRALEYLDNLLPASQRRQVVPLLERMSASAPPANGVKREQVIRDLILDADPVISGAAINWVWAARSRVHDPELERILAARDSRDWQAVEAASWVSRALRLPEDRVHELWVEPFPVVEIASRLSVLPTFAAVPVEDLFRVASAGRQVRHAAGAVIYPDAAVADEVQFLLNGKVVIPGEYDEVDAPAPLAFEAALEGRAIAGPIRAKTGCVCLALTIAEFRDLMAGSASLVDGFLRLACTTGTVDIGTLVVPGDRATALGAAGLAPVDKAILLESLPAFAGIPREETLAVAAAAMVRHFATGASIAGEMDPPVLHVVVSGAVALEATEDEAQISAGPGDAIGLYQMITGIPLVRQIRAQAESVTLSLDREDCRDLLIQRPEFLRWLLTHLFCSKPAAGSAMTAEA